MRKPFALCLVLGLVSPAPAQEQPRTTVRETADVSLVEVPVHVIGRDGKPIAGLKASDFEVEDDGARQTVLGIDVVDLNRRGETAGSAEPTPAAGRRHFFLLFDLSFSKPLQIVRAREAAARFIGGAMGPEDLAAVATTSVEHGARLLVTFSSDRRQLLAAIAAVGLPRAEEPVIDPLMFTFIVPGDVSASRPPSGESTRPDSRAGSLIDPNLARAYTVMAQKAEDGYTLGRVQQHLTDMDSLALALDLVEGRKTIVFFSQGFDNRLLVGSLARGRSAQDTQAENDALFTGRFTELDSERRSANAPLQRRLDATLALFQRSDCIVYPIDLAGLGEEGGSSLTSNVHGEDVLFALANGTGGEVLKNNNDFDMQMRRIGEKTSLTYVLTFRPTKRSGQGAFHPLKVRVKAKGARVSARAGYYETRPFRSLNPLERSLSAADVITHEKEAGFPMEVLALAVRGDPVSRVPVILEIPGEPLLQKASGSRIRLGLYVYAMNASGEVADYFARSIVLDVAKDGARLRSGGLRYCGSLRLLPGSYRLRVFAQDEDRGQFSFKAVSVEVPEAEKAAVQVLHPLFLEPEAPGVNVSEPAGKEHLSRGGVLRAGGRWVSPAAAARARLGQGLAPLPDALPAGRRRRRFVSARSRCSGRRGACVRPATIRRARTHRARPERHDEVLDRVHSSRPSAR